MVRQCPHCNYELSQESYSCKYCGTEFIDNGQLIDALSFWGDNKPDTPKRTLIPLGLVAASGIASVVCNISLILFVGIAAATVYYFKIH